MSDLSGQEQAQQVRWDILAMLSCELRNPLAPIRNAACLLRLRPDDQQTIEQAAGVAERQVAYLSEIAADPLESRTGGRVPTDPCTDEILDLLTHEIATAAANLRNALRGLRPSAGAPAILAAADAIDAQVLHLSRFVDDLLDTCRLERGKVELRQERLDLSVLVRTTA